MTRTVSSSRGRARLRSPQAPLKASGAPLQTGEKAAPAGCTNLKLRQLTRQVSRLYDARVAAIGLKTTQYSLLSHIAVLGPSTLRTLADRMKLDASTLTRNLKPLVAQGWVNIEPGGDARSRTARLTHEGMVKRVEARRAWKQAQLDLSARLGVERVARLHELLDECISLLDLEEGAGEG